VSTKQRSKVAPAIPTMDEAGVPGYDATAWFGLFVPAGTPPEVIAKLSDAAIKAVQTPEVSATLLKSGAEPVGSTPAEFDAFYKAEVAKWAQVIRRAKVQVE